QGLQERDQICFLLRSQIQVEPLIIEVDCVAEGCCASIVKIGCACSETAKHWTFKFSDVRAFSRNHCASGVRHLHERSGRVAADRVDRQTGRVQGRYWGKCSRADCERSR